jgi:hypothetical protein
MRKIVPKISETEWPMYVCVLRKEKGVHRWTPVVRATVLYTMA